MKARIGVEIIDDGNRAIANHDGEPRIESDGKLWKISVDPILTHQGDVNTDSGNIKFRGNVKVLGDVQEYALVDATESVTVTGMVDNAKILAGLF